MWSQFTADSPYTRSSVSGFSFIGKVCTSFKYSVVEENGGLASVVVINTYNFKQSYNFKIFLIKTNSFYSSKIATHELGHRYYYFKQET